MGRSTGEDGEGKVVDRDGDIVGGRVISSLGELLVVGEGNLECRLVTKGDKEMPVVSDDGQEHGNVNKVCWRFASCIGCQL